MIELTYNLDFWKSVVRTLRWRKKQNRQKFAFLEIAKIAGARWQSVLIELENVNLGLRDNNGFFVFQKADVCEDFLNAAESIFKDLRYERRWERINNIFGILGFGISLLSLGVAICVFIQSLAKT